MDVGTVVREVLSYTDWILVRVVVVSIWVFLAWMVWKNRSRIEYWVRIKAMPWLLGRVRGLGGRIRGRQSGQAGGRRPSRLDNAFRRTWERKALLLAALPFVVIWLFLPRTNARIATWFSLPGWIMAVVVSIGVMVIYGATFWLVWNVLAPKDMWLTFVKESTAKVVMRGGKAHKILVQAKGKKLDKDGFLVAGRERHLFGGLRWIGFWPIDMIYTYMFKWSGVDHDGQIHHHVPEKLDCILLKPDTYFFEEEGLEDKDGLPLKVGVLLTLRSVNPYLSLFGIQNWLETVFNRFRPVLRDRIAKNSYKDLIGQQGSMGGELFQASDALRGEFRLLYGVEVDAAEVHSIDPPEKYRAATLHQWDAQRNADAMAIDAKAKEDFYQKLSAATAGLTTNGAILLAVQTLIPEIGPIIAAARGGQIDMDEVVERVRNSLAQQPVVQQAAVQQGQPVPVQVVPTTAGGQQGQQVVLPASSAKPAPLSAKDENRLRIQTARGLDRQVEAQIRAKRR